MSIIIKPMKVIQSRAVSVSFGCLIFIYF